MNEPIFAHGAPAAPARLEVADLRLDEATRPALVRPADRRIDLFEGRPAWRRAELELRIAADRDAVRDFERRHGELAAIVVARCPRTRLRQSAPLARSRRGGPGWEGPIELDRDSIDGRLWLRPRLVVGGGAAPRVAAEPDAWAVYGDEPTGLDLGGRLRVRWVDFRAEGADPLARRSADATHVVAFGAGDAAPEIWLNRSFAGLDGLLHDGGRGASGRAVRGLVRSGLARGIWMALLGAALAAIRVGEDGEAGWPWAEWQREVLRRVLRRVEPGTTDGELLHLAATDWRSYPGACEFLARAEVAVGEIVRANEATRRLVLASEGEGS